MSEPPIHVVLTSVEGWGAVAAIRAVMGSAPGIPPEPLSSAVEKLERALREAA